MNYEMYEGIPVASDAGWGLINGVLFSNADIQRRTDLMREEQHKVLLERIEAQGGVFAAGSGYYPTEKFCPFCGEKGMWEFSGYDDDEFLCPKCEYQCVIREQSDTKDFPIVLDAIRKKIGLEVTPE